MTTPSSNEQAFLYPESSLLDRQELVDKFAAWSAGLVVPSKVEEVGVVPMPARSASLLHDPQILEREYEGVDPDEPLFVLTAPLRYSLRQLAYEDMGRAGLKGYVSVRTLAGMYEYARDADPLHADHFHRQQVRWTVAHGTPGTVGGLGEVSKSDLVDPEDGTLRPEITGKFSIIQPEESVVTRFSVSDVHAGCRADGPRILTIATFVITNTE